MPLFRTQLLLIIWLLCSMTVHVHGWSCLGHMLVAEIAQTRLSADNRVKALLLASSFAQKGPFPRSPSFTQLACWADDLRGWHQYSMAGWHYVDFVYDAQNLTQTQGGPTVSPGENIISATTKMITALSTPNTPQLNWEMALAFVVHFIGDIHQPLHACTRVSSNSSSGDRGGNGFVVKLHKREVKLHSLWDQLCSVESHAPHRPLSRKDEVFVSHYAQQLTDTWKFDEQLLAITNPRKMALESYAFAVNASYAGVVEHEEVDPSYLERCKEVAEARVTLAGFRLARILNAALDNIDLSWDRDTTEDGICDTEGCRVT